jgi:hypothetical protein
LARPYADVFFSFVSQLCYTRGSVIPCWLTLTSGDVEALELYAAPDALSVHLHRCVRWQSASTPVQHTVDGKTSVTGVARAVWWQRVDDMYTRTMEGELRVPADLVSSSAMGTFSISVRPPRLITFAPVLTQGHRNAFSTLSSSARPILWDSLLLTATMAHR